MKSKDLNSKDAIAKIKEIDNLVDLNDFVSEDEDRKTVLKAKDEKFSEVEWTEDDVKESEETGIVIETVTPEPIDNSLRGGNGRVKFVSNGSNPKLGVDGTVKYPAERTAQLFVNNGWGYIDA